MSVPCHLGLRFLPRGLKEAIPIPDGFTLPAILPTVLVCSFHKQPASTSFLYRIQCYAYRASSAASTRIPKPSSSSEVAVPPRRNTPCSA